MIKKKGQTDTQAVSILVMLIGFFMLIYIILLPPADRALLLNETTIESGIEAVGGKVLLSEAPGKVYSYSTNVHNINIEPMQIYAKEESQSFNLIKAMSVSHHFLKDNYKEIFFTLDDITELKGAKLFFLIKESKGPVSMYLNGKLLYEGVLTSSQLPLELPLTNLQKNNKLEFYAASPGWKLFSTNYYLLQDIQLLKTFKVEKTTASRTFYVSEEIGEQLRKATLNYLVTCNLLDERPTLTISLNNRQVFKDTVFCEYLEERNLPLSKTLLNEFGKNKLEMQIDKGDINIDDIKVKAELTRSIFPTYTADVSTNLYKRLQNGDTDLFLQFSFADSGRKRAKISVQGEQFSMDTPGSSYKKDISEMVDNGANTIKIEPLNNFEIVNLKVFEE